MGGSRDGAEADDALSGMLSDSRELRAVSDELRELSRQLRSDAAELKRRFDAAAQQGREPADPLGDRER